MSTAEQFITIDFNLPNHANELSKAEEVMEKIRKKLENHKTLKTLDDKLHTSLYEEIVRVLDYLGHLSQPAFNIEDRLEALYTKQYIHAPELAKRLWLDHYESLHHPYNILKNRCFRMLEELDELYISMYGKNPKNWNI